MTILSAVILLGVLIFIHELGHFLVAKLIGVKVLKFSLGFGPGVIGRKFGETEYVLSAVPLGGYVKMLGEEPGEELDEAEKERSFQAQSLIKRSLIVVTGPLFNILLTFVIFTVVLSIGLPINVPVISRLLPVIDEVQEGYPAYEGGMKKGDVVLNINERKISTWLDMVDIVSKSPGKKLSFRVKRGKEVIDLSITPRSVEEEVQGKKFVIGRIGVRKLGGGFFDQIKAESLLSAPYKGMVATYKMGFFIADSIRMLISGDISVKNLGGPVTILKESGKAASAGVLAYFMFMAVLSVNLGILNLLPVPVLDGGHLLLFGIEGLKGSPLNEKTIMFAHRIGYALIIILMVFALYNDFMRIFSPSTMP
ncbi:MAG TPA: RIP metalloprotease RseP [Nitrospirae bacterium]|nr:RIP metalloprotease RseP [Nitrospirota bacterium]